MSDVVLDASAALSLILPTQASGAADELLQMRGATGFVAPYIFVWEVGNVLARLRARGLLALADDPGLIQLVSELDLFLAPPPDVFEVESLKTLAAREGLRLFDAAYLALAVEKGCGLASRDARLLQVARTLVPVYDLLGDNLAS